MFELIVILCLMGEDDKCGRIKVETNSCPGALHQILEKAPEGAVVRGLTCRRAPDLVLPPTTIRPEKDEKEHLKT